MEKPFQTTRVRSEVREWMGAGRVTAYRGLLSAEEGSLDPEGGDLFTRSLHQASSWPSLGIPLLFCLILVVGLQAQWICAEMVPPGRERVPPLFCSCVLVVGRPVLSSGDEINGDGGYLVVSNAHGT